MRGSKLLILILLSLLLTIMVAQKINLTTADLGRYLKNGEIMLQASSMSSEQAGEMEVSRSDLLYTNLYSYTEPDFPFVNHHWGTGIIFYLIFSIFGWAGLSIFNITLLVGAFALMFLLASRKLPNTYYLLPTTLFLIPLITDRTEIRPETISYLFIAIFIYVLSTYLSQTPSASGPSPLAGRGNKKVLYLLPVLMILWANLHIYFVFGIFILGAFMLERLARQDLANTKKIGSILLLSILASFITPFGPKALLYPFTIFQNYGYRLVENQSILFLENINFTNPNFIWWKITAVLAIIATAWSVWKSVKNRSFDTFPIALGLITLTFGILSFTAIRNFSIFGLVLLPYLAYILGNYSEKASRRAWLERSAPPAGGDSAVFPEISEQTYADSIRDIGIAGSIIISLLLLIIIPIRYSANMPWGQSWGIGLMPNVNASAEFVSSRNIEGPIFSNYDIGGYLIYHLYPEQKVFVDNRPEAYSVSFFEDTYVPMQEEYEVWSKKLAEYNFNTIWFYRHDYTPWAQSFLIERVQDPEWAPIFVDNFTIIFVRRIESNSNLIEANEIPKSVFGY